MEGKSKKMTSIEIVNKLIRQVKEKCLEWVEVKDSEYFFIDPHEGKEISAHYGASHAAVSFLILGLKQHDSKLESIGVGLLTSVLKRWESSSKLADFHNDFNNFALCIAADYLREHDRYVEVYEMIKNTIMSTPDSNHDTINWLPMRWYVNKCRYKWSGENCYKEKCLHCAESIKAATFEDGFIDDRLPKGTSFNLQYDVATVALLQFLRVSGEEINISNEFGALLKIVAPDGDINYLGRGTNQVFAWGLWIYLLSSTNQMAELEHALMYCEEKVAIMLQNNNIMLNEWDGHEKFLWWDYHYCSVYTAHFLFWLIMAKVEVGKKPSSYSFSHENDSGIEVVRQNGWFVTLFSGRKEYLSERGPVITAIGTEDGKMVVKGNFGPWQDAFGYRYFLPHILSNNIGLTRLEVSPHHIDNSICKKIRALFPLRKVKALYSPIFCDVNVETRENEIEILFSNVSLGESVMMIPLAKSAVNDDLEVELLVDGLVTPLTTIGALKNQYGLYDLLFSSIKQGKNWLLRISKEEKV